MQTSGCIAPTPREGECLREGGLLNREAEREIRNASEGGEVMQGSVASKRGECTEECSRSQNQIGQGVEQGGGNLKRPSRMDREGVVGNCPQRIQSGGQREKGGARWPQGPAPRHQMDERAEVSWESQMAIGEWG
ncbi:unnamed protein product [Calypogeia fissa]